MKNCRASVVFAVIVAVAFFAGSFPPGAAAAAGENQQPVVACISAKSPQQLVKLADSLLLAGLRGSSLAGEYLPGMLPAYLSVLQMPWLLDNDAVGMALLYDVSEESEGLAIYFSGIDYASLADNLTKTGVIGVVSAPDGLEVNLERVIPNTTVRVRDLGNNAVLVMPTFRPISPDDLGGWRPAPLTENDVEVTVNLALLRSRFAEKIRKNHAFIHSEALRFRIAAQIGGMPDHLERSVVETLAGLTEQAWSLGLETDLATAGLRLDEKLVQVNALVKPMAHSSWSQFIAAYDNGAQHNSRMAGAVDEDFLWFSSVFEPYRDFTGGIGSDGYGALRFAQNFLFEQRQTLATLHSEFSANQPSERVETVALRKQLPLYGLVSSVNNGRQQVQLWLRAIDMVNMALQRMAGRVPSPAAIVETGRIGPVAYHAIKPRMNINGDVSADDEKLLQYIHSSTTYLAASSRTAIALGGPGAVPEQLAGMVERLADPEAGAWHNAEPVAYILNRLTPRQIGYALFRPTTMLTYGAYVVMQFEKPYRFKAEDLYESFQDSGGLAGLSWGVRDGGIAFSMALPVAAVNDAVVNFDRLQAAQSGQMIPGPARSKPPVAAPQVQPIPDSGEEDWNWGGK